MTDFPIRRNMVLLAASLACLSGMLQLAVAVATITLVAVTGVTGILGLAPAIFLGAGAAAALPAGRAMDRYGRVPVLAAGFVLGIAGCTLIALGCAWTTAVLLVPGFATIGGSMGTVLLARAAAADMAAPERRSRAISLVLFGAVFGALLGPFVFGPLFSGKELAPDELVVPWLAGAAFMAVGLVLVLFVRPDPRRIAAALHRGDTDIDGISAAPLRQLLQRTGVRPALVASVTSFSVMVAVMTLTGYVMIGHGHDRADVFPVVSAHIVGMYGLVLFVGDLIEYLGRRQALIGGLLVMGASALSLAWVESVISTGIALFGLGLGWSFSYVAATSELVDLAAPSERGRLLGFADLTAGAIGAALALAGGAAYSAAGAATIGAGGALLAAVPALLLLAVRRPPAGALEPAA